MFFLIASYGKSGNVNEFFTILASEIEGIFANFDHDSYKIFLKSGRTLEYICKRDYLTIENFFKRKYHTDGIFFISDPEFESDLKDDYKIILEKYNKIMQEQGKELHEDVIELHKSVDQ